ncbi:MAG TPA: DUF1287 domain-containing protein [Actinobacteria bacterium]|jgi:uncharacterized protein YijF (DUF1287 family)|nr:DUF1287 domain-containing protein [Actinomycetota bacterium]
MKARIRKSQRRRKLRYDIIIVFFIALAALQFWTLKSFYKELKIEIPQNLFKSFINFPLSENIRGKETELADFRNKDPDDATGADSESGSDSALATTEEFSDIGETTTANETGAFELSDEQKKIVLRVMKLLEEDIEYQYQFYADTGYPDDKYWISTDVVSVVLKDCGYDLMELVYDDMSKHIDAYPMNIKGSKNPDKKTDFRVVYFQQKFFQRNALELPTEFDASDPANILQWQPGDIVYFTVDAENPGKNIAGMLSNHSSPEGVPLVIMITKDLGKITEINALAEMEVSGHYRYPYPELNQ